MQIRHGNPRSHPHARRRSLLNNHIPHPPPTLSSMHISAAKTAAGFVEDCNGAEWLE